MITIRPITTRAEWLSWRKEVLTASDLGAVAGVDQYKTPLRVYAEKLTDIDVEETALMRRGRMFEAAATEYLREDHPDWVIEKPNSFYVDVDLKLGATPDILAKSFNHGLVNIQIKTVSAPVFEGWNGTPPLGYLLQTVCENLLTKANEGILAVLVVSAYKAELHEFPVPRHAGAEKRVCNLARQFWKNVKAGIIPRPDYRMDGDIISVMKPPVGDTIDAVDLSTDNRLADVLAMRETLKSDIKKSEEDVKALDAEIIDKLNGATLAYCNGWKITNKLTHRNEYTVAAKSFPVLRTLLVDTEGVPQ